MSNMPIENQFQKLKFDRNKSLCNRRFLNYFNNYTKQIFDLMFDVLISYLYVY